MATTLKGQHAGFVSRLIAYGIDLAIIVVTLIAASWLVRATGDLFQFNTLITVNALWIALAGVITFLFLAGYYIFFWILAGQTPGKMIMGVRVVTMEGEPLNFWRSVRRFIGYILSFLALYIGFLWILVDNNRQGWHDKMAGTIVIYIWDAEPGKLYKARVRRSQENSSQNN